ncbi:hypothetical protein PFAS1_20025 [Pseudomonas frederiksbergensis]|nr:hypothetical protein PFAS1_20025 [Pseudomonas frederiksbergensis]
MGEWHAKVMPTIRDLKENDENSIKIGRVWEQLAGDIFYSNHQENLWYWDEEKSFELLSFWADFDPNIYFLIAHTPLELLLQQTFESAPLTADSIEAITKEWITKTERILSFKKQNIDKCEIIDVNDYRLIPEAYLNLLSGAWRLSLDVSKISSTVEKPVETSYYYLCSELSNAFPNLLRLKCEVLSMKLKIVDLAATNQKTRLNASVACYKKNLNVPAKSITNSQQKYVDQLLSLQDSFEDISLKYSQLVTKNKQNKQNKQIDTTLPSSKQKTPGNKELKVNDHLLTNLHQTQELLENQVLELRVTKELLSDYRDLAVSTVNKQSKPWLLESFNIIKHAKYGKKRLSKLRCSLKNLFINGVLTPQLNIEIQYTDTMAGIVFLRERTETSTPLQVWPFEQSEALELKCMPAEGSPLVGDNKILSSLGASDWTLLLAIAEVVKDRIENDTTEVVKSSDREKIVKSLFALEITLKNWPLMLRYDSSECSGLRTRESYSSLEFKMTNLSIGQTTWSAIDYRLSTVDEVDGEFGVNPRLEFLPSTRQAIQGWFAESDDIDRGARLELRFALPDLLDIHVWSKLTELDHLLISGIVSNLPRQLTSLKNISTTDMTKWNSLAANIRMILKQNTAPRRMTTQA